MTPRSPQRFGFQFTGDQETREEYEKFRALMSHEIPSGEMALVLPRRRAGLAARAAAQRSRSDRSSHQMRA